MERTVDRARVRRHDEEVRRIVRDAALACDAAEATFWVLSAEGDSLEAAVNYGPTADIVETLSVPLAGSVVGMVASTGMAASIAPGEPHNPIVDEATHTPTTAMAAACVMNEAGRIGVLSAINPRRRATFDAADLQNLEQRATAVGALFDEP